MQRLNCKFLLFCFSILFFFATCSTKTSPVILYKQEILLTTTQLNKEFKRLHISKRAPLKLRQSALTNIAMKVLALNEAKLKAWKENEKIKNLLDEQKKYFVINSVLNKYIGKIKVGFSYSDLEKFNSIIECRLIWFKNPWLLDRTIWKEGQRKGKECLSLLKKKETSFADLAERFTDNQETKCGKLGVFSIEELSPSFRPWVTKLKTGEFSPVISESNGFFILRLDNVIESPDISKKKYEISCMFFASSNNPSKMKLKAEKVLEELKLKPESFCELVNRYSDLKKGGLLKPFLFENMNFILADAAWKSGKTGRHSDLIEGLNGFFIVKTEKIRTPSNEWLKKIKKNKKEFFRIRNRIIHRKFMAVKEEKIEKFRRRLSRIPMIFDYSCFSNSFSLSNLNPNSIVILKIIPNGELFTYADFLKESEKYFNKETLERMSYSDKALFFEKKMLFPSLAYFYGLKKGLLNNGKTAKQWKEMEEEIIFRTYLKDKLNVDIPSDEILKNWWIQNKNNLQEPLRSKPFESIKEEVKREWFIKAKKDAENNFKQSLFNPDLVKINSDVVLTSKERRLKNLRITAQKYMSRGCTNDAVSILRDIMRQDPDWLSAASLYDMKNDQKTLNFIRSRVKYMNKDFSYLDNALNLFSVIRLQRTLTNKPFVKFLISKIPFLDAESQLESFRLLADFKEFEVADFVFDLIKSNRDSFPLNYTVEALNELGKIATTDVRKKILSWLNSEKEPEIQVALLKVLSYSNEKLEDKKIIDKFLKSNNLKVKEQAKILEERQ